MTWEEKVSCILCHQPLGSMKYYHYSKIHTGFFHITCIMNHYKICNDKLCDCHSIQQEFGMVEE